MLRCSNRLQSAYRNERQQSQRASKLVKHSHPKSGSENIGRAQITRPEKVAVGKGGRKAISIEPPDSIALISSTSSSSVSSTSTTIASSGSKTTAYRTRILPPPPPPSTVGHSVPGYPRGMIPASPNQVKTPPTQAPRRLRGPPKLFRVTANPNPDSSLDWGPFKTKRKYSDLQVQQQQQQQLQQQHNRAAYHRTYWRCPSRVPTNHPLIALPTTHYVFPGYSCAPEVIGHPSLRIFKLQLPADLMALLDQIIVGCETHALRLASGWHTDLYSLTRQDLALVDVPGMLKLAMPIVLYLSQCICEIYHANAVKLDRNQPHMLKYNQNHRGVELHHDRCDVTANLVMSRSNNYQGGGTFFPDLNKVVRLKYGEFLLHPGSLVHGGSEISRGARYLMVLFANLK